MGIRSKLKERVQGVLNKFSGEYSEPAPKELTPYTRGVADENVEVVMARLNRPSAAEVKQTEVRKVKK